MESLVVYFVWFFIKIEPCPSSNIILIKKDHLNMNMYAILYVGVDSMHTSVTEKYYR